MTRAMWCGALSLVLVVAAMSPVSAGSPSRISKVRGPLTVFAASSLQEAFTEIGERFQRRNPDAEVTFSFASSSTLATQIEHGAPADVFASADVKTMERLLDGGHVPEGGARGGEFSVLGRNRLALAVEPGNPLGIDTLRDTIADDVTLVLCAAEVPCGRYAREAYAKADVELPEVATGASAKDVLAKIALGEADAAVVYVTDVEAADGDVSGVRIPARHNVTATYPISPVVGTTSDKAAKTFILFVRSKTGQKILERFGFLAP